MTSTGRELLQGDTTPTGAGAPAERYALLVETAELLIGAGDPQAVIEAVCRKVARALDCDLFFNFLTTEPGRRLRLNACAGVSPEQAAVVQHLDYGAAVCGCVAQAGERIVAERIQESADDRTALIRRWGVQAYCCHPLMSGGAVIGTLSFGSRWKTAFTADEVELMRAVTNQVALAMQRLRSEQALRDSEQQFRALADSMPNLAWCGDADGYLTWYNRRWYEYTGTTPAQMEGWGWQSVHDPAMLPKVLENWRAAIAHGEPFEMEFPLRGADGKYRWFLTRGIPVKDDAGHIVRWFGTNTDVSAIRDAREALEAAVAQRTAELQEVVREMSTFSYSVSHDLRSPVRTITTFAELVMAEHSAELSAEARDHLGRIARAGRRMDSLITDVLAYSRVSQNNLQLDDVETEPLVRDIIETQVNAAAQEAVAVVTPLPRVRASRPALEQCLANLIGNAVKFARADVPLHVTIRGEVCGSWARISVEDNGIGIKPEHHEKVWGMFERLSPKFEGTGIGLAIVRRAVERMGGRVGLESTPGVGSRFWIELPAA